jgi:hypothetical protein
MTYLTHRFASSDLSIRFQIDPDLSASVRRCVAAESIPSDFNLQHPSCCKTGYRDNWLFITHGWDLLEDRCTRWRLYAQADCSLEIRPRAFLDPEAFEPTPFRNLPCEPLRSESSPADRTTSFLAVSDTSRDSLLVDSATLLQ